MVTLCSAKSPHKKSGAASLTPDDVIRHAKGVSAIDFVFCLQSNDHESAFMLNACRVFFR